MKKFFLLLLLLVVATTNLQVCQGTQLPDALPAPRFTINLDIPPKERWLEVVDAYKSDMEKIMIFARKLVPQSVLNVVAALGAKIESKVPYPYNYEILGIAEALNGSGVEVGDVILANLLYEFTAFDHGKKSASRGVLGCTSIVAQTYNGSVFHGRNLDYSMVSFLENMTIIVDFQSGGKTKYTGTTYAGFVGLLTGQKAYKFTVSLDERDRGRLWMNALVDLTNGLGSVVSFHIRNVLEQDNLTFDQAVLALANKNLIAPCYLIVGGVKEGEGVVITRERLRSRDLWMLNSTRGQWYVLETNYDRWTTPPPSDDRRASAIKSMEAMTRSGVGNDGLYKVLSTPPVFNSRTTYTTIMSASQPNLYGSWIRYFNNHN